jgi:acyl dehydratase
MFTMAQAARVVTDWAGDPGAIVEYGVRFTRPVVVPDDDTGAMLEVSGKVVEKIGDQRVRVQLTATSAGQAVLGRAFAVVRLGGHA